MTALAYDHWREVPAAKWRWPNFTPKELASRDSGRLFVQAAFVDRLQALRSAFAKPMAVTSGYRAPGENAAKSATGVSGPHTTGRAVDVRIAGEHAFELVRRAMAHGFTGIGIHQRGEWGQRFIHLDDLPDGLSSPRPRLWSY